MIYSSDVMMKGRMMMISHTNPDEWRYYPLDYPYDKPTAPPQPQWSYNINVNMWMTCPQCSKLVQWGSVYCPSCGAKMITEITEKDKLDQVLEKLDEILEELKKE